MGGAAESDLGLLYQIARSRLDTQLSFLDSLDTKLGLLLSVGAGIFAVAGAIVAVAHSQWSGWTLAAIAVTTLFFIGLAFKTILALRKENWGIGPRPGLIALIQLREGDREATKLAIKIMLAMYTGNEPAYARKASAIVPASIALAMETLTAAAALASVARG